jgi:16S rRNA (adenine1518-N6/adenine1519-N6)-dimethyltransferase
VARQKLGQHFLLSGKILERIARAASAPDVSLVVEIGPGRGALTRCLLRHALRVVAIELDAELAAHLRQACGDDPRLEVVEADALNAHWSAWGEGALAGNLPYYAASAIISKYVRSPGRLSPAVFLIQKEVAERITATPGTREYGYFSVECQLLARAEYLFTVPPGAFRPPPKVDSAVIRLTPRAVPPNLPAERFLGFVSTCFRHKRKTLRNNLTGTFSPAVLDGRPEMSRRAEQLSVAALADLYRALTGNVEPALPPVRCES